MATLLDIYLKKETLETLVGVLEKKGEKGVSITVSINDESNNYGQNTNSWVTQTKEQRESKKDRFFTGSGRVFWTDGTIKVATKQEAKAATTTTDGKKDDLPF